MANDLVGNPWVIDTTAAIDTTQGEIRVRKIKWVGATTAAHAVVVQDGGLNRKQWEDLCPGGNYVANEDIQGRGMLWHGCQVTTIQSGRLYIYFDTP